MKKHVTLLLSVLVSLTLYSQSIVGEWKLTEGKYNNAVIASLTGELIFTDVPADDSLNYKATFNNGTHSGTAKARYTISGNKIESNLNNANFVLNGFSFSYSNGPGGLKYNWTTSLNTTLAVFNQWGKTLICFGKPAFSISGNVLTLTSSDGKTVLKYENQNPVSAGELEKEGSTGLVIYPNPAADYTNFRFKTEKKALVRLKVYDLTGRLVETIIEKICPAGEHSTAWQPDLTNGQSVTGLYLCQLEVDGERAAAQMLKLQK